MKVTDHRQCTRPDVPLTNHDHLNASMEREDDRLLEHIIGCEVCMSVIVDLTRPANVCAQECRTFQTLIANGAVDATGGEDTDRESQLATSTYHM